MTYFPSLRGAGGDAAIPFHPGPRQEEIAPLAMTSPSSMRHAGGAVLVDEHAGGETVEREWRCQRVRRIVRDRVGEDMAGTGRRLEPASAPAAIQIKAGYRQFADDRRGVGRH